MLRERYRQFSGKVIPSPQLIEKVKQMGYAPRKKGSGLKRAVAAVCAAAVCVCVLLPVMAKAVPGIYDLMYLVSPGIAQFFMPVQKSCEDNGIRMEVVSAYIHGDTAEIYITLQDLLGDRVDETTDLFDSYSIQRGFDSSAQCRMVGYDSGTKTATFLITITEWGNHPITGDKVTFSVREFLSGKQVFENLPIGTDLSEVQQGEWVIQSNLTGGSGAGIEAYFPANGPSRPAKVLRSSAPMAFPVEGIDFTGIGYIDGKLHLQTAVVNNLEKDNHGYFFLKDKNGAEIRSEYQLSFLDYNEKGERVDYEEYVFDIPQEEIHQYELYGYFVTSEMLTKGDWKVTFPLENTEQK